MVRVRAGGDAVCLCVRAAQNSAGIIACTLVTFSLGDGRQLPLALSLSLYHTHTKIPSLPVHICLV